MRPQVTRELAVALRKREMRMSLKAEDIRDSIQRVRLNQAAAQVGSTTPLHPEQQQYHHHLQQQQQQQQQQRTSCRHDPTTLLGQHYPSFSGASIFLSPLRYRPESCCPACLAWPREPAISAARVS